MLFIFGHAIISNFIVISAVFYITVLSQAKQLLLSSTYLVICNNLHTLPETKNYDSLDICYKMHYTGSMHKQIK